MPSRLKAIRTAMPHDHGWILGDSLAGFEYNDVLMYTTDGGVNWNKQFFDLQLQDVFFIDQDHGWITGENGTILYSNDGGDTWEEISVPDSLKISQKPALK